MKKPRELYFLPVQNGIVEERFQEEEPCTCGCVMFDHYREVSPEYDAAVEKMREALEKLPSLYTCDCHGGYIERGLESPTCVVHDLEDYSKEALEAFEKSKG